MLGYEPPRPLAAEYQIYIGGPPSLWGTGSQRARRTSDAALSLIPKRNGSSRSDLD